MGVCFRAVGAIEADSVGDEEADLGGTDTSQGIKLLRCTSPSAPLCVPVLDQVADNSSIGWRLSRPVV